METLLIFWTWWRDRVLELLPGHAQRRENRSADGIILSDVSHAGALTSAHALERRRGVDQSGGRMVLDGAAADRLRAAAARGRTPIVLGLPGDLLLERQVTLPIAAERDLGRVLLHEMDRFTPFTAAEVLWSYTTGPRDRAQGRVTALLSLVPLAAAAPALDALRRTGLMPASLELAAPDGERRRIPLVHADDGRGRADRWMIPALACIVVLLILAVVSPFLVQSTGLADVNHRIAALTPAVRVVQRLRSATAAGATGTEVIAAERRRVGDALEAIALLTASLPDNTYLTGLTYNAGKLTMDGQSKSAAALIAPLTANPRLQDASFTAPVVRNTLGLDSFSLRVRVTR